MALTAFALVFVFLGAPMITAGYLLATKPESPYLRATGAAIILVGLAPFALWLIFMLWFLFVAEG